MEDPKRPRRNVQISDSIKEAVASLESLPSDPNKYKVYISSLLSNRKLLPSVLQAPSLELKPLLKHLKYVYVGKENTLPVIIAWNLKAVQEEKLVHVLINHKIAIRWILDDIKGISPPICIHKILLEDGVKPTRETQRRLNLPMMEDAKKEILNLLDVRVIYPISDSKWVSIVQVIPKKYGITLVKNEENELVAASCLNR
ncbi:Retrovirus-related Pol polyprotein [Quillaja saponaria]|uniref:Retrovirus-related Pol polyprotein n=1 Tax=Quillaja saponaria TaxID=32244 RepID=A0AAD7LPI6_QUISA|nr:Retrovirus-related Pol polyprotein [Quillaja saponaria]